VRSLSTAGESLTPARNSLSSVGERLTPTSKSLSSVAESLTPTGESLSNALGELFSKIDRRFSSKRRSENKPE
jgi:hypothetical protein